ncbi:cold shock domain-containing protein [Alteromonas lipolytica]|uniref:CSD domain-containing protein n=1 Tax=Alteromonas lipolytica TaxID=1856405 RepID=A0A1E8FAT2_9ALTE|nr:cold shock domain-containing protein [Alteromonas lipolytica]OFI33020.1 hypothetical protein BFC17_01730 [Alteromonas lipolytica]GGF63269.1 cold-shock protein [Alteromonas lipolytica]
MRAKGTLKSWNNDRGFGFITAPLYAKDVFVHISAFTDNHHQPRVGEPLTFDIEQDKTGKVRAIEVKSPISGTAGSGYLESQKQGLPLAKIMLLLALIVVGFIALQKPETLHVATPQTNVLPYQEPESITQHFKCDGRQYCGQMNSRAEAEFFLANCPDTKMDGDDDGIPCENDTRF